VAEHAIYHDHRITLKTQWC